MTEKEFYNKLIFKKYRIISLIGIGSFGFVFGGINVIDKTSVALKVEDWKNKGDILEGETYTLYHLKGLGIPEVKSFGIYGKYKVLVENLLGDSLDSIFIKLNLVFTLKDICMIALQLIDRFEFIHSKYIIHRDIKPDNITVDYETNKIIHIIDFGLAKKYRSSRTGKHIKFSIPKKLTGTARFASTNSLSGKEQSRRDDLESIGYVLIYFAKKGFLPWQGLKERNKLERYRQIYYIKKLIKPENLCSGLPEEFCDYIKYVKSLKFEENPNYDYLRGLFINIMNKMNYRNDLNFSWLKHKKIKKKINNIIIENNSKTKNLSKRRESPQTRIYRNILNSREKEKNINKKNILDKIEEKQEKRDSIFLIKKNEEILNKDMIKENKRNKYNDNVKKRNDINNISEKNLTQITQFDASVDLDNQTIELQKYKNIISKDNSQNKNKNEEKDINNNNIEKNNNDNNNEPTFFNKINDAFNIIKADISNNDIIDNNKELDIKKNNNHNNSRTIWKFGEDDIQNVHNFSIKSTNNVVRNNIGNIKIIKDNLNISNDFVENNALSMSRNYKNNFNRNNNIIISPKKRNIEIKKGLKINKLLNYSEHNLRKRINHRNIKINKNYNLQLQKINKRKKNHSNNRINNSNIELKTINKYSDNNIIRQLFNNEKYAKFQKYNSSKGNKSIFQTPINYNNNISHYYVFRSDNSLKKKENQQKIEINLVNNTTNQSYQIPIKTKKVFITNSKKNINYLRSLRDISSKNNSKSLKRLDNKNYSKILNNKNNYNKINFNDDIPEIKSNYIRNENIQNRTVNINKQLNQENLNLKKIRIDRNIIKIKKKMFYNKLSNDNIYNNSYINPIEDNFSFSHKYLIKTERYQQHIPTKLIYNSKDLNNNLKNIFIKNNNNSYIPYNIRNNIYDEYNNNNINLNLH